MFIRPKTSRKNGFIIIKRFLANINLDDLELAEYFIQKENEKSLIGIIKGFNLCPVEQLAKH